MAAQTPAVSWSPKQRGRHYKGYGTPAGSTALRRGGMTPAVLGPSTTPLTPSGTTPAFSGDPKWGET